MDCIFDEIKKSILHGQDSVIVTIVKTEGSSPGKTGSKMLVCSNGKSCGTIGGGDLEFYCIKAASEVLKTKISYTKEFKLDTSKSDVVSMICGGNVTVQFSFIDKSLKENEIEAILGITDKKPRVLIFGGGHVGSELCPVLEHIGFDVIILDDRPEFASPVIHQKAKECILCGYSDISKSVSIEKDDYIVIMTHGHVGDREVLLQACKSPASYIGCIGSHRKVEMTRQYLRENGVSESRILEVHSPIGLPIGGSSPQEIAISVAAEIIQHRYKPNNLADKK